MGWGHPLGDGDERSYGMWNSQRMDQECDKVWTVKLKRVRIKKERKRERERKENTAKVTCTHK